MTLPVFLLEDGLVTDGQVRRLREKRMAGKTLAAAAAAAGMSERTARKWQSRALPSTAKAPRTWRTREDPFADVWPSEVVAAVGGGYGGTATGADAVHVAEPATSGSLSGGATADAAAAGSRLACAARSGSRGLLRAGSGSGAGSSVRLHGRERLGGLRLPRSRGRVNAFGFPS